MKNKNNYIYSEFAFGHISNRNNIQNIYEISLPENRIECYKGMFDFTSDLVTHVENKKTVKGFQGAMTAECLPFDFDGEDLEEVKKDVLFFLDSMKNNYGIDPHQVGIDFSGKKGFHVSLYVEFIFAEGFTPSKYLPQTFKKVASTLCKTIKSADQCIYETRRLFRIQNTLNAKSGLYKIPLTFEELRDWSIEKIKEAAKTPRTIDRSFLKDATVNMKLNQLFESFKNDVQSDKNSYGNISKYSFFEKVPVHERNNKIYSIVGILGRKKLDEDCIESFVALYNSGLEPPLPDKEVESIMNSRGNKKNQNDDSSIPYEVYNIESFFKNHPYFDSNNNQESIKLGFPKIDDELRDVSLGELLCVLGPSSVGKSTFCINAAMNIVSTQSLPTLIFSPEVDTIANVEKMFCIRSNKSIRSFERHFLKKQNPDDIHTRWSDIFDLHMNDRTNITIDYFESTIDRFNEEHPNNPLKVVIIDHIGILNPSKRDQYPNLYERTTDFAKRIKGLAREKKLFIVLVSQVNKNGDARDSGCVYDNADYVLNLLEEELADKTTGLYCEIKKNRRGRRAKIQIILFESMLIQEFDSETQEE